MPKNPKVSVIIPAYNCAPFLPEAIDSVLAQSFSDFEIVVVNDGSTDDTDEVVQPYREAITYISGPNGGASVARNLGLKNSTGELIAFLDADDRWHREKLSAQVALMDAHPEIGVSYTNFTLFGAALPYATGFDERGSALLRYDRRKIGECHYLLASESLLEDFLLVQAFPKPSMLMVRRRCMKRVGDFDESQSICEDTQMCLRLAKHFRYGYVDRCLVERRVRTDTLSSAANDRRYLGVHIQMLENLEHWIELSKAERKAVRQSLARYRYSAGYLDFSDYEFKSSRKHLARSFGLSLAPRTLFYLTLTLAPRRVVRLLRTIKQRTEGVKRASLSTR